MLFFPLSVKNHTKSRVRQKGNVTRKNKRKGNKNKVSQKKNKINRKWFKITRITGCMACRLWLLIFCSCFVGKEWVFWVVFLCLGENSPLRGHLCNFKAGFNLSKWTAQQQGKKIRSNIELSSHQELWVFHKKRWPKNIHPPRKKLISPFFPAPLPPSLEPRINEDSFIMSFLDGYMQDKKN